jgi:hypothetical protein
LRQPAAGEARGHSSPKAHVRVRWTVLAGNSACHGPATTTAQRRLLQLGVYRHWLPMWLPQGERNSENTALNRAPSRIRTCGLLLRRHSPDVARCGWVSPDVPSSCTDSGWTWLGVAQYLPLLAPRLAPQNLISFANVRPDRTQYRPETDLTTQRDGRIRENVRRPRRSAPRSPRGRSGNGSCIFGCSALHKRHGAGRSHA